MEQVFGIISGIVIFGINCTVQGPESVTGEVEEGHARDFFLFSSWRVAHTRSRGEWARVAHARTRRGAK